MEKNVCKMTDDSIFLIDIEKILKTKAGKKYKYIPRFCRFVPEAYRASG